MKVKVTLEEIDLLRKRANVSYEDAKGALEKFDGDVVEALVYLEKANKVKQKCAYKDGFIEKCKSLIKKGNETRFVIKSSKNTVLNISVNLAILITILITPPVAIIALIAAIFTKHKIRIEKTNGNDSEVNKVFDKVASAVDNITSKSMLDKE